MTSRTLSKRLEGWRPDGAGGRAVDLRIQFVSAVDGSITSRLTVRCGGSAGNARPANPSHTSRWGNGE